MPPDREYVHTPAESRRRGLPAIGFRLRTPEGVRLVSSDPEGPGRGTLLRVEELGPDGRRLGCLEIGLFSAALVIDRNGILEHMASEAAAHALEAPAVGRLLSVVPVQYGRRLDGYRAEVMVIDDGTGQRPEHPYRSLFALAPLDLAVERGLAVILHSARPQWPAGEHMVESLQVLAAGGQAAVGSAGGRSRLPFFKGR